MKRQSDGDRLPPVMRLRAFALATLTLIAVAELFSQVSQRGPQVGEVVPDFSLVDQSGATQTLKSVLGPAGAILVFFRSADW